MNLMHPAFLLPLAPLGVCAWYDWKIRLMPDWAISLCWLAMLLPVYGFPYDVQVFGLAFGFAFMYFANTLSVLGRGRAIFGDGDVLLAGPLLAFCSGAGQPLLFVPVMLLALALGYFMKKGCPVAAIYLLGALAAALLV